MEAVGLAVGVVALVGLVKDCIDFFSYFSASSTFGRDYEILDAKLHIEKTVFLQWTEGVGLLYPGYDKRLDNPETYAAVNRILVGLRQLLGESQTLQKRYGLKVVPQESGLSGNLQQEFTLTAMGRKRENRFSSELKAFQSRIEMENTMIAPTKKIRWAVVDKNKFKDLVDEVMYFTSRLRDLVPLKHETTTRMVAEDINDVLEVNHLRLAFDAAVGYEDAVAEAAKLAIPQRRILRRLWFRAMDERRHAVKLPHSRTLKWTLQEDNRNNESCSLPKWFKSGSGIYWLSGKAGSGKSTLMKYLLSQQQTHEYLFTWAGNSLVIESFFLWHLGHAEQRSIEGLRQALLYKILEADPQLIQGLLPVMWQEVCILDDDPRDLPSAGEIDHAFHTLVQQNNMQKRFCFFIDGLDEYSGNPVEAINLLELLASSPSIKIVASSRPIPACVSAFSENPQLLLQELNRTDIEAYVQDKVWSHRQIPVLLGQNKEKMTKILGELVDKSSGVFLWVVLACMSILEGIANFDRISELESRVQELPKELEDLFHDMIMRTEPRYREEGAHLLWMCYWSQRCSWKIPSIGLALADNLRFSMNAMDPFQTFSPEQRRQKVMMVEGRIRSRCSGLLEIAAPPIGLDNTCFCGAENDMLVSYSHDKVVDSEVTFIHRSVFEFLEDVTINGQDCSSTRGYSYTMLSYISLRLIAIARYDKHQLLVDHYLGRFLQFANSPSYRSCPEAMVPLKILDSSIRKQSVRHWTNSPGVKNPSAMERVIRKHGYQSDNTAASPLLCLAIEGGCLELIHFLIEENHEAWKTVVKDSYALHLALIRPTIGTLLSARPSLPMICYLLESGCGVDGIIKDQDGSSKTIREVWFRVSNTYFKSDMIEDPMVYQVAKHFPPQPQVDYPSTPESQGTQQLAPDTLITPQTCPVPQDTELRTTAPRNGLQSRMACGILYILYQYFQRIYNSAASWIRG